MSRLKKILVANRGEIALRVLRSAKELGLKTVAVYSEVDAKSLHVQEADEAFCIGPAESKQSYLNIEKILEVAKKSKTDGIHPGYGFLSEKEAFAAACEKAGLTFIGPSAKHIFQMGDKVEARKTMEAFGVPVVPGTGALTDLEDAEKEVDALLKSQKDFRFPLLVKATGGGGGKGMRLVKKREELRAALERARSEAESAFGNPVIFVERYIEEPRHIEVQILGDGKNSLALFERECSLQRRHQKVVEEALSPSLSEATRKKMLEISETAIKKMGYQSAGTLEFIVSREDDFYFLEMNTRIQVEHPVTEAITGVDLIRSQIEIANGEKIKLSRDDIRPRGHAIELRLYAEDCENGFLPQPGPVENIFFPPYPGVRVDAAVLGKTVVSPFYDPMIAKITAHAADREQARLRLLNYLQFVRIQGLVTNKAFLMDILSADFFKSGHYHTGLLEQKGWRNSSAPSPELVASVCLQEHLAKRVFADSPLSPWQQVGSAD